MKKALTHSTEHLTADEKAFRILCRLGPFFGALGLGSITMYIDWLVPPPGLHAGEWDAVYPYLVAIAGSVVAGAVLGGAFGESYEHQAARRTRAATDTCLRWSFAIGSLFVLIPFADIDDNLTHLGACYASLAHLYAPALILNALLMIRGALLYRHEKRVHHAEE